MRMNADKNGLPLEGGCQCGAVRYRLTAPPLTLYCCHCSECQAQSASAFGMSLLVAADALETDWAACRAWSRPTASGARLACHFCPGCGSRLFHIGSARAQIVSVKAGSLDRRDLLQPVGHIWTMSAQPWFRVPAGALATRGEPEDMAPFMERWRQHWTAWRAKVDAAGPERHKSAHGA